MAAAAGRGVETIMDKQPWTTEDTKGCALLAVTLAFIVGAGCLVTWLLVR